MFRINSSKCISKPNCANCCDSYFSVLLLLLSQIPLANKEDNQSPTMDEDITKQLVELKAELYLQRCDLAALLNEIERLSDQMRVLMKTAVTEPKVPLGMVEVPNIMDRFQKNRTVFLNDFLNRIEKIDPEGTALIREYIESSSNPAELN